MRWARQSTHIASPGTYDQKHVTRIGHLQDCVAYGPGILELAHQPDEFIVIDDMVASAKIMAEAAVGLLTGALVGRSGTAGAGPNSTIARAQPMSRKARISDSPTDSAM